MRCMSLIKLFWEIKGLLENLANGKSRSPLAVDQLNMKTSYNVGVSNGRSVNRPYEFAL